MRIELERKKVAQTNPGDVVRMAELSCYMTLCGMNTAHKFLAYKTAMNNNYKIKNCITAAHFAR
jgi:coatomer protein complex subunit alpha (xenin)